MTLKRYAYEHDGGHNFVVFDRKLGHPGLHTRGGAMAMTNTREAAEQIVRALNFECDFANAEIRAFV